MACHGRPSFRTRPRARCGISAALDWRGLPMSVASWPSEAFGMIPFCFALYAVPVHCRCLQKLEDHGRLADVLRPPVGHHVLDLAISIQLEYVNRADGHAFHRGIETEGH